MFTKLIGIKKIHINDTDYEIRYYRKNNLNGNALFTSEVNIGLNDKIILDDHSMVSLEYKVDLVLPAALYSRIASSPQ
ncbi:MAG: hypothetical protein JSW70_06870 [Syntrophobacterales bacterium]|nr:MAG: hypothetical protein JSW70_06870 [Syntrophobacterales bacterium]